jgi:hypothetical protein
LRICSVQALAIFLPVATEPVKVTASTLALSRMA